MLLTNRVAVITGAASERGIGRATARLFHEQGAKVAVFDLDRKPRSMLPRYWARAFGIGCDVTDSNQCLEACEIVLQKFGRIDALINSAELLSLWVFGHKASRL